MVRINYVADIRFISSVSVPNGPSSAARGRAKRGFGSAGMAWFRNSRTTLLNSEQIGNPVDNGEEGDQHDEAKITHQVCEENDWFEYIDGVLKPLIVRPEDV